MAGFWRIFKPSVDTNEILSELNDAVQTDKTDESHVQAIQVLRAQRIEIEWGEYVSAIENKLKAAATYSSEFVVALLASLWLLKQETGADAAIRNLVTQSFLLHYLYVVREDFIAAAYCFFSILYVAPKMQISQSQGQAGNGRSFILNQLFRNPQNYPRINEQFVKLAEQFKEYDIPFQVIGAPNSSIWADYILRLLSTLSTASLFFTTDNVLKHWDVIKDAIEDVSALLEVLINDTDILEDVTQREFDIKLADLYAALVRSGATKHSAFKLWCVEALKEIDADTLQQQVDGNGPVVELITELVQHDVRVDLGQNYQEVLFNHGIKLMDAKIEEAPDY